MSAVLSDGIFANNDNTAAPAYADGGGDQRKRQPGMNAITDGALAGSPATEPADRTSGQVKTLSKGLAVLEMIIANETVRTERGD